MSFFFFFFLGWLSFVSWLWCRASFVLGSGRKFGISVCFEEAPRALLPKLRLERLRVLPRSKENPLWLPFAPDLLVAGLSFSVDFRHDAWHCGSRQELPQLQNSLKRRKMFPPVSLGWFSSSIFLFFGVCSSFQSFSGINVFPTDFLLKFVAWGGRSVVLPGLLPTYRNGNVAGTIGGLACDIGSFWNFLQRMYVKHFASFLHDKKIRLSNWFRPFEAWLYWSCCACSRAFAQADKTFGLNAWRQR